MQPNNEITTAQYVETAKLFGAAVEKAQDGRYNFFTHPNNCAFGAPLPQTEGEYPTSKVAWLACGKHIVDNGMAKAYEDVEYQGWTNSATFLTNQYVIQEQRLYEGLVLALKTEGTKSDFKKILKDRYGISVVKNKTEDADDDVGCGLVKGSGKIRLDNWAKGEPNWTEIRDSLASELGIEVKAKKAAKKNG